MSHEFDKLYRKFILQKLKKEHKKFIKNYLPSKIPKKLCFCDFCTLNIDLAVCITTSGKIQEHNGFENKLWLSTFEYKGGEVIKHLERNSHTSLSRNKSGEVTYRKTYIPSRDKFPKPLIKLIGDRGLNLGTNNPEQRFIAALKYDINNKDVHHINYNALDNHIDNLLPISESEHSDMFHETTNKRCYTPEKEVLGYSIKNEMDTKLFGKENIVKNLMYNHPLDVIKILELNRIDKLSAESICKIRKTLERKHNINIPELSKLNNRITKYKYITDLTELKKFIKKNQL